MEAKLERCTSCLNAITRPRIEFDENGVCNACNWAEEKKLLDWGSRWLQLERLCERFRGVGEFDCLVAVSGGKDGSYVAHNVKTKLGMNPLCITVRPPLESGLGSNNLVNFIRSGFEHLHISTNQESMRVLDRVGFELYGQGYFGWLIAIHTAVLRIANLFNIKLIFYSEDGEIEYGGSTAHKNIATYSSNYMKSVYLNNQYDDVLEKSKLGTKDLYWFGFDDWSDLSDLVVTHWSFFEPWDPYRNYLYSKEHCGLLENTENSSGTFTNFAQNDQKLASLHYYLMYLKFGFGRATQDAGIEIRRGAMTRQQAINLVSVYDNQAPESSFQTYADYYGMTLHQFCAVLDKFANKDLFSKSNDHWVPVFKVE